MAELEWWDDILPEQHQIHIILDYFSQHGFLHHIKLKFNDHAGALHVDDWLREHDVDFANVIESNELFYYYAFKDPDEAALFKLTFA